MCFKTTTNKKLFQQMFNEGEKKSPPGFLWEVAFPLTLNNFGGVAERGVGRSQGGPMTGLLCGPGWVREGWDLHFEESSSSSRRSGPGFDTCFPKHKAFRWPKSAFQRAPLSQLKTWARGVPRPGSQKLRPGTENFPTLRTRGASALLRQRG